MHMHGCITIGYKDMLPIDWSQKALNTTIFFINWRSIILIRAWSTSNWPARDTMQCTPACNRPVFSQGPYISMTSVARLYLYIQVAAITVWSHVIPYLCCDSGVTHFKFVYKIANELQMSSSRLVTTRFKLCIYTYICRKGWCFRFEDFMGVMRILAESCRASKGNPQNLYIQMKHKHYGAYFRYWIGVIFTDTHHNIHLFSKHLNQTCDQFMVGVRCGTQPRL